MSHHCHHQILLLLFVLTVTTAERFFTWGNNQYYAMGDNTIAASDQTKNPFKISTEISSVSMIVCSIAFTLVLTGDNKLYGWGNTKIGAVPFQTPTLISGALFGN